MTDQFFFSWSLRLEIRRWVLLQAHLFTGHGTVGKMVSVFESYFFVLKIEMTPTILYLLICFWLCWVLVAARAFLSLRWAGATLQLQCVGLSIQWLLLLQLLGSRAQTRQPWCMDSGVPLHVGSSQIRDQTMPPALADGFFTTEPPGKPLAIFLSHWVVIKNKCN